MDHVRKQADIGTTRELIGQKGAPHELDMLQDQQPFSAEELSKNARRLEGQLQDLGQVLNGDFPLAQLAK